MKNSCLSLLLAIGAVPAFMVASPETDREIEASAAASYNFRKVLGNQVEAKSSDGVVTLTGTVQDQDQKELATETAANLPGVTEVINEIAIECTYEQPSDSWLAFKIRGVLLVKANVSVTSTSVRVRDGVVTLTGSAKNQAQKELTGVYASEIEGVKSVTNYIAVSANPEPFETPAEIIDDASITAQVKFALLSHKSTSALKASIKTVDGVVRLTGEALNDAEKSLAGKLAEDVRGVKSVTNDMTVKG